MKDTIIKVNFGTNEAARNVDYFGKFNYNMYQLESVLVPMTKKALNTGGYIIKKSLKDTLENKWPASGRPFTIKQPKHPKAKQPYITKSDPISDGVRQSSVRNNTVRIYSGGGESHAAGYLAKMYEHDSKKRYQRVVCGVRLARPKPLGKLTGVHYFDPGVNVSENKAYEAMERIIYNTIEKTLDE